MESGNYTKKGKGAQHVAATTIMLLFPGQLSFGWLSSSAHIYHHQVIIRFVCVRVATTNQNCCVARVKDDANKQRSTTADR
mmetsp:Transcript_7293/g.11594  ORF Transcript_7293/g.11594 Transcript_7293/m.11594 type:complete len:81 (+) Transcript_7293:34-276(+)